jgi:hypothetical protein
LSSANDRLKEAWLAGKLVLYGIRTNIQDGSHEPIDARRFDTDDMKIEILAVSTTRSDMLVSATRLGKARGMSGAPRTLYEKILIERAALLGLRSGVTAETPITTGGPGRRSSRDFILAEARRRLDAGYNPEKLSEFAAELANWFDHTPMAEAGAPRPTARTVEGHVRLLFNSYKARKRTP